MSRVNWQQVHDDDCAVPPDTPLAELTEELTRMLGSTDPQARDRTAVHTLATWLERGVYDDLLTGLGDGMAAGLAVGLGLPEDDSVFRRSVSVRILTACIERDNGRPLVLGGKVLAWGDAVATWLLREQDLRAYVSGKGWAHAVARGADALASLARSPHFGRSELTVLLDVVADRVLARVETTFCHGEEDRLALATAEVLRRNAVPMSILEPWINRLAAPARPSEYDDGRDPYLVSGNAQGFLRALYLQLALGTPQPAVRADLMLVLVDSLRATNPAFWHGRAQ